MRNGTRAKCELYKQAVEQIDKCDKQQLVYFIIDLEELLVKAKNKLDEVDIEAIGKRLEDQIANGGDSERQHRKDIRALLDHIDKKDPAEETKTGERG